MTVRPPNKRGGCSTELGGVNTLLLVLYIQYMYVQYLKYSSGFDTHWVCVNNN